MKAQHYTLRALARLLAYPDAGLRAQLLPLVEAIDAEAALPAARRAELSALVQELLRREPLVAEARYVETFDRGRATALHLFEHVHGDSRERGPALIDLAKTYEQSGLYMAAGELPDHLPVVLEFASSQTPAVAKAFLGEMAHILKRIFSALRQRNSPYAAVLAAVLELAGHKAEAVPIDAEPPLDEDWAEPEAFAGCSTHGQARPGATQPMHFVRQAAAQSSPRPGVMA